MYFKFFSWDYFHPWLLRSLFFSFQVFEDFPVIFMFRTVSVLVCNPSAPENNVYAAVWVGFL